MSCGNQVELFEVDHSIHVPEVDLHEYDVVIINSSAGKDSSVAIYEICRLATEQKYDKSNIHISHQDLGESEWKGTKELVKEQAEFFGIENIHYSKRRDSTGYNETLLEYVERRGKWPARNQRYCTSDFKRGPGARVVTSVAPGRIKSKVLYVFGFRAEESPDRKKKEPLSLNENLTTKSGRKVYEYLPVHNWTKEQVWETIKTNGIPYHYAYDLGMPRLSCCFCIFSPFDALVIAGQDNPELLDKYIRVEKEIEHTFKDGFSIEEVRTAIENNYEPKVIEDWVM